MRRTSSVAGQIAILILLAIQSGCVWAAAVGEVAPDWSLKSPDGETIRFYDAGKDRISVILFWATWCPFCRTLMPHLQTVAWEYTGLPVDFYALNVWEDADPETHLRERGFSFSLLLSAEPAAAAWGVKGTPGLFVVDRSHVVRYVRQSGEDDRDVEIALREAIDKALKVERR